MKTAKCGCLYEGAVQFCPTHEAAPRMKALLESLLRGANQNCGPEWKRPTVNIFNIDEAKEILAEIEKKPSV